MVIAVTAPAVHNAAVHATSASSLELAAPFLVALIIILISVFVEHEVVVRLENHYEDGWTEKEIEKVDADRAPGTHALAAYWAIDAAQIPAVFGIPVAGVILLRKVYHAEFLIFYFAVAALGIGFFFYFLRQVSIHQYPRHGVKWLGFRITPLVIFGFFLNTTCAMIAAYLVR